MQCPICGEKLQMTDRQGIEIDYCPDCRGVWLDRGELDKLIERSMQEAIGGPPESQAAHQERRDHAHGHGKGSKKKKSLLSELFDF